MKLQSVVKGHRFDQDKVTDPETTVKDALARLGEMGDLEQVDIAFREHAIEGAYCFHSLSNLFNASGKGLTPEQARASAAMEFAERYSWLHYDYRNAPGYAMRSYRDMVADGLPVPEPAGDYFLANFPHLPEREPIVEEIVTIPLHWVRAWSLTDDAEIYYPINWHNMVSSSNGLAAGNSLEEAIVQATCEVIERENIFRLFVEKRPGYTIDPESITHPLLLRALEQAQEAGIEMLLTEISSDLGVPTFIARGTRAGHEGELTWRGVGHGTHPHPERALIRAVSEYFEGLAAINEIPKEAGLDMAVLSTILPPHHYGFHALLNPEVLDAPLGTRRMEEIEDSSLPDLKDEVEMIVERLRDRGWAVHVTDKTYAPLGIPTVRVWIPGMRNCVNNDITTPDFAISEVWHEAGNSRASMEHMIQSVLHSPFMKVLRGGLSNTLVALLPTMVTFDSSMVYKGDYRDALKSVGRVKKGGLGMLESMGNIRSVLESGGMKF